MSAELLLNKKANHLVFHLCVLVLEEIGKIFISFQNFSSDDSDKEEKLKIPLDDHVKKLFWAIWGPSFMEEKISQQQLNEIKGVATRLHDKRLNVLYTDVLDTCKLSEKITDNEVTALVRFTKARLDFAKVEGDVDENYELSAEMAWFLKTTEIPHKRLFIFGDNSQDKLIEFGEVYKWIIWLKEHFSKEENSLKEILNDEVKRERILNKNHIVPKWKMKFSFVSQSHSIRQNVLNLFNEKHPFIKLSKGNGNHTIIVETTFGDNVSIVDLWGHGIVFGKLFVAALNVASNGLIYWNISTDIDKYYEKIWDLENKKELSARLENAFRIKWEDERLVLTEEHLYLAMMVHEYFYLVCNEKGLEPVDDYISALGMMAKTDIHLRLEKEAFIKFYTSFISALRQNENVDADSDFKELGYEQIAGMIKGRTEFDKVMDIGKNLIHNKENYSVNITLTEVIGIKMYSGIYLMTLAIRKLRRDNTIRLMSEK